MNSKIPILALVGFLGSGKTSLLNHILKENQGLKIGVIVNDFGAINIDSMLVATQTDTKLELSNGCICCAIEDSGLDDAISQIAYAGSLINYIIVEASGLAEPRELVRILENSKNKFARLDGVVAVVDTESLTELQQKHNDFLEQLNVADIIILNKTDLVSKARLKEARGYLEFLNSRAHIITAQYGVVDTRLLLDIDSSHKSLPRAGENLKLTDQLDNHEHEHFHSKFSKVSFSSDKPLDPKKFDEYINNHLPKEIYRAKGFIYFGLKGLEQKFIFQLVGARNSLKLDDWRGQPTKTELVFIGTEFDQTKLLKDLNNLIDDNPMDIGGNLMDLNLYK